MYTCGIIGHRLFKENIFLEPLLEELIFEQRVSCFNFGTKSQFTLECAKAVARLQKHYPFVKMRIFLVKGEMCFLKGQESLAELVSKYSTPIFYDEVYEKIIDAGKLSYIKRNQEIVDNSDIIFCYYNYDRIINKQNMITNSGTAMALTYAKKQNKQIINVYKQKRPNN